LRPPSRASQGRDNQIWLDPHAGVTCPGYIKCAHSSKRPKTNSAHLCTDRKKKCAHLSDPLPQVCTFCHEHTWCTLCTPVHGWARRWATLPGMEGCASCEAQQAPLDFSACELEREAGQGGSSAAQCRRATLSDFSEKESADPQQGQRNPTPRNARRQCMGGSLGPRPPQRNVSTAGFLCRGRVNPVCNGGRQAGPKSHGH
jgi:hypothetical protein